MPDFVKVCSVIDVKKGEGKQFKINGKELAVFNIDGEFYCVDAVCTHSGGPLAEGAVENCEVECPWHGARFNLKTGAVLSPPAPEGVTSYELKISGNDVMVKL